VAACEADPRVVAAFVYGSHAAGAADAYSDVDLGVVTTDEAYEEFLAGRCEFVRRLGEPLLLEDFDWPATVFFVLADGMEGELAVGRASGFTRVVRGPCRALLDRAGILAGAVFTGEAPARDEQIETLRRVLSWFWHDVSHLVTALGRGQLWWAAGQLDVLRVMCVNLARLAEDFTARPDGHDKVDAVLPAARLAPLASTWCPLDGEAMRRAALTLAAFHRELGPALARAHGVPYPDRLAVMMCGRLQALSASSV
jgi:streptomycin adenylyltransferase